MKQSREPLFQMHKRGYISSGELALIHLVALLLALMTCAAVIMLVTEMNPLGVYETLIIGAVGNPWRLWVTIRESDILLLTMVGLTPAFRMRFWNIGAEGQILIGGIASVGLVILPSGKLPNALLLLLMPVCSMLFNMIWGLVSAYCKARRHTNEILFMLMMNYVTLQSVTFAICFWENPKGPNSINTINQATRAGWFPRIGGTGFAGGQYIFGLIIILLVTVLIHLYLIRTKQGFEISVVGADRNTIRYTDISVQHVILRTMTTSGVTCGLAGAVIVGGIGHTLSISTANGRGFAAILVAWTTNLNPFFMALTAILFYFMQQEAIQIATQFKLNQSFSDIITRIVPLFLIGCEFFVRHRLTPRKGGTME